MSLPLTSPTCSHSHLSLSTPAGLVRGGFSSNCTLYIWSRFDILCHYFMIHWSAEWKNWIVFFAARAQQRAKLALIFSEASGAFSFRYISSFKPWLYESRSFFNLKRWKDLMSSLHSWNVTTVISALTEEFYKGSEFNNSTQQGQKHAALDCRLSIFPLNLSSLYSTKRSPL